MGSERTENTPDCAEFWRFATAVYAAPGAQAAALTAQSRGAGVILMLYLLWLWRRDRRLAGFDLTRAMAMADRWEGAVMVPVRAARDAMKGDVGLTPAHAAATRERVLAFELTLERAFAGALLEAFGDGEPGAAQDPLARYAERLSQPLDPKGALRAAAMNA